MFWVLYRIEHPFFEQYKIYPGEWPWKEDKKAWDKLFKDTIKVVLFNNLVLIPLAASLIVIKDNFKVKYSFAVEDLPDAKTLAFQIIFSMWV